MLGIRVDANEDVASGHLMRCLSIASSCRKRGVDCLFIVSQDSFTERIKKAGFSLVILDSNYKDLEEEIERIEKCIAANGIKWLIVDSYFATRRYLETLNRMVNIFYIDDFGFYDYSVSAVLHYNSLDDHCEDSSSNCRIEGTERLVGLNYVPLREEFVGAKEEYSGDNKCIVITTGGSDHNNMLDSILSQLKESSIFYRYTIYVIIGGLNRFADLLVKKYNSIPNIVFLKNIDNVSFYMRKADLAIAAGGSTIYELFSCGVPTVSYISTENQDFIKELGEKGYLYYAGDIRDDKRIERRIVELAYKSINNRQERQKMSHVITRLVDGMGADRISGFIEERMDRKKGNGRIGVDN